MQYGVAVTTRQLCVDSNRTAPGDCDGENSASGRSRWKESNVLHQLGKLVVQVVAADGRQRRCEVKRHSIKTRDCYFWRLRLTGFSLVWQRNTQLGK